MNKTLKFGCSDVLGSVCPHYNWEESSLSLLCSPEAFHTGLACMPGGGSSSVSSWLTIREAKWALWH